MDRKQSNGSLHRQKGFALLIAVLVSSVVLAIGLSIANVTLKQLVFSGIGRESEIAFYAADAGMECALFWDTSDAKAADLAFTIGQDISTKNVTCMGLSIPLSVTGGNTIMNSGETVSGEIQWNNPAVCARVFVTKYSDPNTAVNMGSGVTCPAGAVCTRVESRGYNRACSDLDNPRTVERALRASY